MELVAKQYDVDINEIAAHKIDGASHALFIVDDDRQVQYPLAT